MRSAFAPCFAALSTTSLSSLHLWPMAPPAVSIAQIGHAPRLVINATRGKMKWNVTKYSGRRACAHFEAIGNFLLAVKTGAGDF